MPHSLALTTTPERPGSLLLSSDGLDDQHAISSTEVGDSDELQQHQDMPSNVSRRVVVIDDPRTLLSLGKEMASAENSVTVTDTRKPLDSGKNQFILETASIEILRIGILAPISPGELTPKELNGGVDGPTMSSLIQEWREAFRSIPDLHSIERVEFDMRCREPHEPRHIVRFLQEVSTVMYMKVRKNMGRELIFEVTGCERRKKTWLEASLPGEKVV